jgi:hypothetical protein
MGKEVADELAGVINGEAVEGEAETDKVPA